MSNMDRKFELYDIRSLTIIERTVLTGLKRHLPRNVTYEEREPQSLTGNENFEAVMERGRINWT